MSEVAELETRVEELEKELTKANEQIEDLEDSIEEYEDKITELEKEKDELEEQVEEYEWQGGKGRMICGYEIDDLIQKTTYLNDESKFEFFIENFDKISEEKLRQIIEG
jgi:predicted  nucleic acid-binding Zn-ribbon protein